MRFQGNHMLLWQKSTNKNFNDQERAKSVWWINTCILFLISERASNIVERVQFPNSCIDMQSLDRVRALYNSSTYELHYNYLAPNKIIFQD